MDIYLVFNELSAHGSHITQTKYQAQAWMSELGQVITAARNAGLMTLAVREDFFETTLVDGYFIRNWLNDREVDPDLRRRIRSAGTALYPLPDVVEEAEERQRAFNFNHEGSRAHGLGSAYLLESVAVSLNTSPRWQVTTILLDVEEYDESADDIVSRQEHVIHVCQTAHITIHRDWIQDRFITSVSDGRYLIEKCASWFPNLRIILWVRSKFGRKARM